MKPTFLAIVLWLSAGSAQAQLDELQRLAALHLGADQGVFVQARDGTILVAQQETKAVHPASVTKTATTLALLARLGPEYRFDTRFIAGGPLRSGRLDGDLLVESSGDPTFVFENAFLVLRQLHARGLREVRGDLRLQGPWMFNWQPDTGGRKLKRTLQGIDGTRAWTALGEPSASLPSMALRFRPASIATKTKAPLAVHHSPPLREILKALNNYSNNIFHPLSQQVGGPKAVESMIQAQLPAALRSEVLIDNAAGADETNRLSPRAAVSILWKLEEELHRRNMELPDVLPVNGFDSGTLDDRLTEEPYRGRVVGKTGTYGSVGASALVGVLRTPRYGEVAFAVLNSWVPVPEARQRQDAFVRALIEAVHAQAWDYVGHRPPVFSYARVD